MSTRVQKGPKNPVLNTRLSSRELRRMIEFAFNFPVENARLPQHERTLFVSGLILQHFFGYEWAQRQFVDGGNRFLRTAIEKWEDIEGIEALRLYTRVIDFAEMLINLQYVSNFDECLQLFADSNIEAGFAELQVGRILSRNAVPFHFNKRRNTRKTDYDLAVTFRNSIRGCADTKCLLETTDLETTTILDRLRHARGQLPDDAPGAVFVKLAERKIISGALDAKLRQAVAYFFTGYKAYRGTTTVVIVNYLIDFFSFNETHTDGGVIYMELYNSENNKFGRTDWALVCDIRGRMSPGHPYWWKILPAMLFPELDPRLLGYRGAIFQ